MSRIVFALVAAAALGGTAFAQEIERPVDADLVERVPVVIDGETLFPVRGVSAYPAERRARGIADRIRGLAADRRVESPSLTLLEEGGATWIVADGGLHIMTVGDDDALLERTGRTRLAQLYVKRIGEAVAAYRGAREPALLARHAAYAVGATLLLLVAAYAGRWIVRRLQAELERRYKARVRDLGIQAVQFVKAEQIWRFLSGLLGFSRIITVLAGVYLYLGYVLALFPWTRSTGNELFAIAVTPLRTLGLGLLGVIPKLVFLAILALVTRYLLRLIRLLFDGIASGTVTLKNFEPEWALPTYKLVRLLGIALALVVAYPAIPGSGSPAFKGISLFVGVLFSLGSSSLIGNIIAGQAMTYRRAFRIGDMIAVGEHLGEVTQIRLLVTHLRTFKNEEVIVPNSSITGDPIMNYSKLCRDGGLILHTTVGIGYETPWRQVEAILREAAARTPGLLREPAPFVLLKGLGDFCVTYEINAHCDAPLRMNVLYAGLHRNILDLCNEYGVQIMTPAYESDPQEPKVVPKSQWYAAPARPPMGTD